MIEAIGSVGAGLLAAVMGGAMLFGSIYVGAKAWESSGRKWVGWFAGAAAFATLLLVFGPSYDALRDMECANASDYEACLNGD